MMTRVLITGASGLLGRAFTRAFADLDPVTCAWSRATERDLKLDLTDAGAVMAVLAEHQPDHDDIQSTFDSCKNFIVETQESTPAAA